MTNLRTLGGLIAALAVVSAVAACGGADPDAGDTGDEQDVLEKKQLFGDDRVADALRDHPELVPASFQDYEKLFKVGRQCAREDSKEIFVVEEPSSRADGEQTKTNGLLPRAVVSGCNTDRTNPDSVKTSFELFAALISSPKAPGAATGDPMLFTPLEVMALDRFSGTYNFYVFTPNAAGKPGTIVRVLREPKTNTPIKFERGPDGKSKSSTAKTNPCFSCHVNGGPIMNEMARPWTNWVSVLKTLPKEQLKGETLAIAAEAAPIGDHSRSSFANDLEQIMKASIRAWVNGSSPTTGFGLMTLEGSTPGGIPLLLRSSFCQTELNYVSSSDTVPLELFVDPDAAAGSGLLAPPPIPGKLFPFQLPVRSEHDKRVEKYMQKMGFLSLRTVAALRLIDDEHDIFSKVRCDLHAELVKQTFDRAKPGDVDAAIRKLVAAKVTAKALGTMSADRTAYLAALVDTAKTDAAVATLKTVYLTKDLTPRITKATALLNDAKGQATLTARLTANKTAAKGMFPGASNPLPVLEQ